MSGKYEEKREKKPLTKKKILLLCSCLVLALLSCLCIFRLTQLQTLLPSQRAAERWRGASEERFAQVSAFLSADGTAEESAIDAFRDSLEQALTDASLKAPENGSLWQDAWSGTASVTVCGPHGEQTVKTLGVGGDFFAFHPLYLRSGAYLTSRDYMADRVILDEELAWLLFGSSDVAGMEVTIGERNYPVAGVVARENDFASELAYTGDAGMFMSIEALRLLTQVPVDCYEIVMPDPISGFAKKTVEDSFPVGNGIVVENSGRYSVWNLGKVLLDFGKRSMNTHAVIYPYWENAARLVEDYAALALLLAVLLAICPVVFAVILLIRWGKKGTLAARDKIKGAIEEKIEAKKRKNYIPGGI